MQYRIAKNSRTLVAPIKIIHYDYLIFIYKKVDDNKKRQGQTHKNTHKNCKFFYFNFVCCLNNDFLKYLYKDENRWEKSHILNKSLSWFSNTNIIGHESMNIFHFNILKHKMIITNCF